MMDVKEDWLLWFIIFFDKKTAGSGIKSMPQTEQLAEELHNPVIRTPLLENFEKEKCIQYLRTIFGVLIWQIYN